MTNPSLISCKTCGKQYYYKRSTGCTKLICGTCRIKKNKKPKLIPLEFANCSVCKLRKNKEQFYLDKTRSSGLSSVCKDCKKTKDQIKVVSGYYQSQKYKDYYNKNKKIINQKRKLNGWKYPHKGSNAQIIQYMRNRIYYALKNNTKTLSTIELLGVNSIEELWQYLEKKFTEGMTRKNYGKWHIDHIRPCSSFDFSDPNQQKECFHYTNLQPLWAKDNFKKGNR